MHVAFARDIFAQPWLATSVWVELLALLLFCLGDFHLNLRGCQEWVLLTAPDPEIPFQPKQRNFFTLVEALCWELGGENQSSLRQECQILLLPKFLAFMHKYCSHFGLPLVNVQSAMWLFWSILSSFIIAFGEENLLSPYSAIGRSPLLIHLLYIL